MATLPRTSAMTVSDVRRNNVSRVVRAVHDAPGLSQSDLVRATELAAGAVSEIVAELVENGVLEVTNDPFASGRGRPRRILHLADYRIDAIGAALTSTAIEVRAVSLAGSERAVLRRELDRSPLSMAETSAMLVELLDTLDLGERPTLPPLAISVPGGHDGVTLGSSPLNWNGPLADLLVPLTERGFTRVSVGNDGSYATLAEHRLGAGAGADNMVLLMIGRGFGGSAVVGGQILKSHGAPPGFGHVPVVRGGRTCVCGLHGCVELYASISAIASSLGEAKRYETTSTRDYVRKLAERAEAGEPALIAALADARAYIDDLSQILLSVLHPDALLLGGHGAALASWLLPRPVENSSAAILPSTLGDEAVLLGVTIAALDDVISDPSSTASRI